MTPRVIASLCWYDETPEFLRRLVLSLEGVADAIVAADGPFALYGGEPRSPRPQVEALRDAAFEARLPLEELDGRVWSTQMAKRKLLTSWTTSTRVLGEPIGEHDWMLVVDGDEFVRFSSPIDLRRLLEGTTLDVGYVAGEDTGRRGELGRWRRLFRCLPELTVNETHHDYVLVRDSGYANAVRLHGDPRKGELAEAVDASEILVLGHDAGGRPFERQKAARRYYVLRNQSETEG